MPTAGEVPGWPIHYITEQPMNISMLLLQNLRGVVLNVSHGAIETVKQFIETTDRISPSPQPLLLHWGYHKNVPGLAASYCGRVRFVSERPFSHVWAQHKYGHMKNGSVPSWDWKEWYP